MYEHAYQMDYGAAGKYINTFIKNGNWAVVDSRFTKIQKAIVAMQAQIAIIV
jgi:superoxide dismutase